ncbi:hypothetical protein [Nocardia sp. NPDC005366]|uniref:hypothetical protein n=1 Tax=Nocardia sp. NPDC005366 TaxID=3156878 RepID=UPI0033BC64BD
MAVGHPDGGKRAMIVAVAVLITVCAVHYGRADDHSGVAVASAAVAVLVLFEVVIRMGRRR